MKYEILQNNKRFFGLLPKWEVMDSSEDPKQIFYFHKMAKEMPFLYRVRAVTTEE